MQIKLKYGRTFAVAAVFPGWDRNVVSGPGESHWDGDLFIWVLRLQT